EQLNSQPQEAKRTFDVALSVTALPRQERKTKIAMRSRTTASVAELRTDGNRSLQVLDGLLDILAVLARNPQPVARSEVGLDQRARSIVTGQHARCREIVSERSLDVLGAIPARVIHVEVCQVDLHHGPHLTIIGLVDMLDCRAALARGGLTE